MAQISSSFPIKVNYIFMMRNKKNRKTLKTLERCNHKNNTIFSCYYFLDLKKSFTNLHIFKNYRMVPKYLKNSFGS